MSSAIYKNLLVQFDKIFKHNRQGSFKTKERYGDAFKRFLRFLADEYRLVKLANISAKHIYAYTEYMTLKGSSIATMKTELSAIRFFYDQIPNAKNQLPGNDKLELGRRQRGGIDRTWSGAELERFVGKAEELGRKDYAIIFFLGRYMGLRIHECFRIDTAIAAAAITDGSITIKGKGGLIRCVPLPSFLRVALGKLLAVTPRGQKLFVSPADKTHLAIHRLENFIAYYRSTLRDEGSCRPMTFHGLRHAYAAEQYKKLIENGATELEARRQVAHLLGHGRDEVTRIYIISVTD